MQEYPVYNPQKYNGLGLILSNSSYNNRPIYNQSQVYHTNSQAYRNQHSYSTIRQRSPPVITQTQTKPEGSIKTESRIRGDVIKGDSRIEYVPVEKKVVDYVDQTRYSLVPKKKKIIDYRDFVRVDVVPREVVSTDYYAVEHIRSYIPQVIPEKYVEYVPVEHKNIKYEYIPVERQLIHYPEHSLESQNPRYLGVKQTTGPRIYENIRNQDIEFWQRQYGYVRGQSIHTLNQKIQQKIQRDKEMYFKRFQTANTSTYKSNYENQ